MKHKATSSPDYMAEIMLPYNKLIDDFSDTLLRNGLGTKKLDGSPDQFLSEDPKHSFNRAVIKAKPPQIFWSVEKLSPNQCRIYVSLNIPSWLKANFYVLLIAVSCVFSQACMYIFEGGPVGPVDISNPAFVGRLIFAFNAIVAMFAFFALMYGYFKIHIRYPGFVELLLIEIVEAQNTTVQYERLRSIPVKTKLADWKLFFIPSCIFLSVPIVYSVFLKRVVIIPNISDLILVPFFVLVLYYTLVSKIKRRYSLFAKAASLTTNFIVSIAIQFLLFWVPVVMYDEAKDLKESLNRTMTEHFRSSYWNIIPPNTTEMPISVLEISRAKCIEMCLGVLFLWLLAAAVLFVLSIELAYLWRQDPAESNKALIQSFARETAGTAEVSKMSLRLPRTAKFIIILCFLVFSAFSWAGVLINLSLINALVWPSFSLLPLSHGETISIGMQLMASAILAKPLEHGSVHALRLFLITPALLPFCIFVFLHFRAFGISLLRRRSFKPIIGNISAKIEDIAVKLGIQQVSCVLDNNSNIFSPQALVTGWHPRNLVVFSKQSLAFLENYPKFTEAILAHEIAHLEHYCRKIWKLQLLSQIALLGKGYLTVLFDSVAIEDHADSVARRYLRENGKDPNLIQQAAVMLEVEEYLDRADSRFGTQIGARFSATNASNRNDVSLVNDSLFRKILKGLRVAYYLYFQIELYDYIQREAKYRAMTTTPGNIDDCH